MEGDMVNDNLYLYPQNCVSLVIQLFSKEFPDFKLTKNGCYTGYWWIEYKNDKEDIVIYFDGDIGHHFSINIIIANTKYSLWQFNKDVNKATLSTEKNILYQIGILKRFLL
jgi:hypothetical protein